MRRSILFLLIGLLVGFEAVFVAHTIEPKPATTIATTRLTNAVTSDSTLTSDFKSSSNYPVFQGWFGSYLSNPQLPAPIGIASYGLYNFSGTFKPFVVITDEVIATVQVDSVAAYNSSLPTVYQHGTSLQFNVMLEVNTTTGTQFFWLQNTNRFNTANAQVNSPRDLIFNDTGVAGNPILNVYGGKGRVEHPSSGQTSYIFGPSLQSYSLPLFLTLKISARTLPSRGVEVSFYNQPLGRGYFDTVTLSIPNVTAADIVVSPFLVPPNPVAFDAEIVWVGYCCGYETTFSQMNSLLSLAYAGPGGQAVLFPSLYSFGTQTAERAINLKVIPTTLGGRVMIGAQNNSFLENLG